MKLAVNCSSVGDGTFEGCVRYCQDLDVPAVVLASRTVPGYGETRRLDAAILKRQVETLEEVGLACDTIQFWPPYRISNEADIDEVISLLNHNMDACAGAGIEILSLFTGIRRPVDPSREQAEWDKLIGFYERLIAGADERDLKIAAHFSGHRASALLAGSENYRRLFEEVPSPNNGLLMCVGNIWNSDGERMYDLIREFADRIFSVHMRGTKISWGEAPFWWDTPGCPDIRKIFQVLKEIGFSGSISAEHMPDIRGQNRNDISVAWTMGYMKAIMRYL